METKYIPFSPGAVITGIFYGKLEKISCEATDQGYQVSIEIKNKDDIKRYLMSEGDIGALEKEVSKYEDRNEYKRTRDSVKRIKSELEKKKSGKKGILSRLGLSK